MTTLVLQGPFLTRRQAAIALGVKPLELPYRPELLRISGLLEECYFDFQCQSNHMVREVGRVVLALRGTFSDLEIADWMVRQNARLKELSPLAWLEHGLSVQPVMDAVDAVIGRI